MADYRRGPRSELGSPDPAVEALTRATEAINVAETAIAMARDSLIRQGATALSSPTATAVPTRTASISTETALDSRSLPHSPTSSEKSLARKLGERERRGSDHSIQYDQKSEKMPSSLPPPKTVLEDSKEDIADENLTRPTSRSSTTEISQQPSATPNPENKEYEAGMGNVEESDLPMRELSHSNTRASYYDVKSFSLIHEAAFVAVICCAQLLTQAALAQSIVPLHIIGAAFGISDPAQLSWFPAAYSLTVGTFILPAGRFGDIYGHKKLFIIGWLWFCVSSLLAGFSIYVQSGGLKGNVFFSTCRALQGIGPALMLPNAMAILGRTYEAGNRKNMVFSLFGATAPGGYVLGATFSGLFAQTVGWQWAYWVMGIVTFVMAVLTYFVVPSPHAREFRRTISRGGVGFKARWNQLDGTGMVLGVAGLVLINFAWNQGPVVGWTTPYTYFILIIGFLIIFAFCYVESRAVSPLLPIDAMTRDTLFVLACIALGWSCFGIWTFYTWQMLEVERHLTPLHATAQFTPVAVSGFTAAVLTGLLLHKIGPQRTMLISMMAFTIGVCLMSFAPVHQTYWAQTFVSIIVMPWGMDMSFPSATIIMSNSVKREHQGVAASLVNTVVNYSISIGLGIAGTVETRMNNGGLDVLKGYRSAYYVGIGLAGTGVIVAALFVFLTHLDEKKARSENEKAAGSDVERPPTA